MWTLQQINFTLEYLCKNSKVKKLSVTTEQNNSKYYFFLFTSIRLSVIFTVDWFDYAPMNCGDRAVPKTNTSINGASFSCLYSDISGHPISLKYWLNTSTNWRVCINYEQTSGIPSIETYTCESKNTSMSIQMYDA